MLHEEYIRMTPGADTAVLFIHGIVGSPNHFVTQIPLVDLVLEDWSVYNLLLDGHGMGVEDFSKTSMKKWKEQVWRVFDDLAANHKHVIIAAHSMGTLFAMQLAQEHPEKVPFLFLLAVPMRPWMKFSGAINCLRLAFGLTREDHPLEVALRDASGVKTTWKVWKYIGWIPRFMELFREIHRTEKVMGCLSVPCVAWQSEKDELVSGRSRNILDKYSAIEVRTLQDSGHFYYDPKDQNAVCADFNRRCKEITHD